MPNMMESMASGSTAARQMQQNVYGAQYDQANIAADAQKKQLDLQQEQANIEKTKLSNLVAETGFKAGEESKTKLQQLAQSPDFKAADDAGKLRLAAAVQLQSGDVVNGAATYNAAIAQDVKKIANDAKTHAANDEAIGKAYAAISAVPDADVPAFFDRLPEANKKAAISQIGQENWDKYTGTQKKEVLKSLMLNTKGQIAVQKQETELEKVRIQQEEANHRAELRDKRIRQNREDSSAATKENRLAWKDIEFAEERLDKASVKKMEALDDAVDKAQTKARKTWWFDKDETKDLTEAIKNRDTFKADLLRKKIKLAENGPEYPGKKDYIETYKTELSTVTDPQKVKPTPLPPEQTSAAPTAGAAAPTAPAAVTSTKGSSDGSSAAKPLPMPSTQRDLEKGKFYQTARGPARWTGTGFSTDEGTKPTETKRVSAAEPAPASRKDDTKKLAELASGKRTFSQFSMKDLQKVADGERGLMTQEEAKAELKRRADANRLKE